MRLPTLALALAAATVVAAPVAAQTAATSAAPALREGMSIVTSEGGRVGRIVRLVTNEAGEAVAVDAEEPPVGERRAHHRVIDALREGDHLQVDLERAGIQA